MIRFLSTLALVCVLSLTSVSAQNFSTHKVNEGETVSDVAKRYNIAPSDIYKLNPDIKKELIVGTVLIIPAPKTKEPKTDVAKETKALVANDGVSFKEHKVKAKETLYSISKEYGLSEDDLKKHNTQLYANPVKKGETLQIPILKAKLVAVEKKSSTKLYTVLPKEGKWRIAHKFGITVEELDQLNPNIGEVIQEGQEIVVPNKEVSEDKEIDETTFGYYKVLPQETFYSLKSKIGLEQDDLERLNPGLKESGLKIGMVLKIPSSNKAVDKIYNDTSVTKLVSKQSSGTTKKLAIMLPFSLNRVEFDSIGGARLGIKRDPYLSASLDFYSGVKMALDSLSDLGVKLDVSVFDTRKDINEVTRILKENDFKNMDAVIGPLTSNVFEKVALELMPYKVPVVSPIGVNLNLHENVFQSKPSSDLLKGKIVSFIKRTYSSSNVVIISDSKHAETANGLKKEFANAKLVFSRRTKDGKDANYLLVDDISNKLIAGNNIVFLETKNAGFASNVTSVLASLIKSDVNIILVTTDFNSAFESDEISNEHLSKLQFHFAATSKVCGEDEYFAKKYKSIYNTTPETSAVKGFDLTMDVVLRLVSSGDLYSSVAKNQLTEYVENKFSYKKKASGGYYNDAVYIVKYQDLAIVEVK